MEFTLRKPAARAAISTDMRAQAGAGGEEARKRSAEKELSPLAAYFNKLRMSPSVTISVMGSLGEASKPNAR